MKAKKAAPAPTPYDAPKAAAEDKSGPIWEKKPKNFSIGGDVRVKTDVGRFVAWPKYVRLQRQRKILYQRLKVPPAINQFSITLEKQAGTLGARARACCGALPRGPPSASSKACACLTLPRAAPRLCRPPPPCRAPARAADEFYKLAEKYKPHTKAEKKESDKALAATEAATDEAVASKKSITLKYGINHITSLVESKKAQLVVIAHDVDPIELVAWLPALCRKMEVPYAIVKGKSRLGRLVHKKTATALAFTSVSQDDRKALTTLLNKCKDFYTEKADRTRQWGGNIMGQKSQNATRKKEKALEREAQKKAMAQF